MPPESWSETNENSFRLDEDSSEMAQQFLCSKPLTLNISINVTLTAKG